jgi:hypothetical protein
MFGVIVFFFVMLLPALVELKRPRDAGPRVILDDVSILRFYGRFVPLERIDEKIMLEQDVLRRIAEVIAFLPSLD